MAPTNEHAVATVLSTQVVSHDEKSILVEAGGFTPMRWFLERGVSEEEDVAEPPKKRRKTGKGASVRQNGPAARQTQDEIPLARVTLDLRFPETLNTKPASGAAVIRDVQFDGDDGGLEIVTYGIEQNKAGLRLRVAHPTKQGAVMVIDATSIHPVMLQALRSVALPGRQRMTYDSRRNDHPASTHRCTLKRSSGTLYTVVRLQATVGWRDGVSAFPASVPVGKARVYPDYDLQAQTYPDLERQAVDHTQLWTPQDFYESVHVPDVTADTSSLYNGVLDSELYPFQKRAVGWMLGREGVQLTDGQISNLTKNERDGLSFYKPIQDADGTTCHVSRLQGIIVRQPPDPNDQSLSGGLLAEEMGLGKTVEVMATISLHRRNDTPIGQILDEESATMVLPSKATLIITPPSILRQWQSELMRHAPALKVFHYEGIPTGSKKVKPEAELLNDLANKYDVVLSTYSTLAREVHFAEDPPERNMRHARKFERQRSPLVQVQWWRICLDEAQMVESGVTAAARVACRLPRIHSWAVTGTPLRKSAEDLHGLLIFLRLRPLNENSKLWSHLITNHRHLFRRIFGMIALRHTKAQIREELRLPPQKRVVITVPFTAVEQQHYSTMFDEMCDDATLNSDGSPKSETWDPDEPSTVATMRTWLSRLRQTCLHPQVGGQNKRALGRGQGPLRTVAEVLGVMIENNETSIRIDERGAIASQLLRAHILGNAREDEHRSEKAVEIYRSAMAKSDVLVKAARDRLNGALAAKPLADGSVTDTEDEGSASESTPLLGQLRNNLRDALQLQHVCTFFAATACYQIKSNEALTLQDSDRFKELETQETDLYESAKTTRREILRDVSRKSESLMRKIKDLDDCGRLTQLPKIKDLDSLGGIESRRIVEKADDLFDVIRDQGKVLREWRAKMAEFLLKPLVDEDEVGNEVTGDEYEDSTKQQDELYVYFDAVKALQADMNTFVTGEDAPLIDHEAKMLVKSARRTINPINDDDLNEPCHAPETLMRLFAVRNQFRARKDQTGSIRGLIQEARQLEGAMQWTGGSARAGAELAIVQRHLAALQTVFTSYTKALDGLEKEVALFRSTQNQRLEFYRQLQELSDAVAPHKEELDDQLDLVALEEVMEKEEKQNSSLAQLKTKQRFLLHLKEENDGGKQAGPRICVICQCTFENGVLTVCGHQYCKECIQHWWKQHRTCPVCKRRLELVDFHNITYKPQEIRAQQEDVQSDASSTTQSSPGNFITPRQSSIYSDIDTKLLEEIKSFDLPSSYGTKIDTLARHILWIREHDPGAKSIVFSQYREFLDVLGTAFKDFKIGYSRLGRNGAVEKFRQDPSVDCLLLDAKTDSSGLTLVNATHVFICEPLIQTAVELQAIARVHRIGQTRPTTIWMYLTNDTVEESVYEISVARRLAHVQSQQQSKSKSRSATPALLQENAIEAANSEELQSAPLSKLLVAGKSGGEVVGKDDLWQCLFGKAQKGVSKAMTDEVEAEMGRQLRANAAEGRTAAITVGAQRT